MADFHKSFNTARKHIPGVVSLRELGRRHEGGSFLSTGLERLDELLGGGGLPVGRMSEFCGPASAGKTSLVNRILAGVTRRGGCVAYVDFFNALAPEFLQKAGADLENILWIRGAVGEAALRRAVRQVEILMQSGNFTLVVLDLVEPSPSGGDSVAGLPGGIWFRLQRAAEKSKSVLILLAGRSLSSGASARVVSLRGEGGSWGGCSVPPGENNSPLRDFRNREKRALLLGMKGSVAVMKGGRNGRSAIFHCHL